MMLVASVVTTEVTILVWLLDLSSISAIQLLAQ